MWEGKSTGHPAKARLALGATPQGTTGEHPTGDRAVKIIPQCRPHLLQHLHSTPLRLRPARKPRTVCGAQPAASITWAMVPPGSQRSRTRAKSERLDSLGIPGAGERHNRTYGAGRGREWSRIPRLRRTSIGTDLGARRRGRDGQSAHSINWPASGRLSRPRAPGCSPCRPIRPT